MGDVFPMILQAIGVSVAVATFLWRIQKAQNDKIMTRIEKVENDLSQLKDLEQEDHTRLEDLRRDGDHNCHQRIDAMETGIYKEINERLSHIEGNLKGIENTNKIMIDWLVKNGGKIE